MAAKKVMLWPSARSKYVKDDNMKILYFALLFLSAVMILQNYYLYSFMYGMKLFLMIVVSIILTRETEILFYSHDKDITRQEAKELIVKSYPKITALIYVLLIPIGTPLWLVGLGAVLATLLGKLIFGGYHHMVFHTSLVGVIMVTLGWTQLVDSVALMTSFDNAVLQFVFDNDFFNNTLSIGGVFDPANMTSALGMLLNNDAYNMVDVFIGLTPGIIGSGVVFVFMFTYFMIKKTINWVTPVVTIVSFLLVAIIVMITKQEDITYPLYQLFTGAFLFVVLFVVSDPITTPIPLKGKIVFGVIVGALTMFIRLGSQYEEGIVFAVLFMNMLTPLLNEVLSEKKKPVAKKAPVETEGA